MAGRGAQDGLTALADEDERAMSEKELRADIAKIESQIAQLQEQLRQTAPESGAGARLQQKYLDAIDEHKKLWKQVRKLWRSKV
jgi:anti-sigma-K factor RskA